MYKEPILYVDDEEVNLMLFEAYFSKEYDIILAKSAEEGLKIIENNEQIKVIVSDLKMPVMDGFQFIEKVKKNYPSKICLILSAYNKEDRNEYEHTKDLIFEYINKPLQKPLMDQILKSALENYSIV